LFSQQPRDAPPPPPNSILGPPKHVFYSVSALGPSKTSCFLESGALWLQRPVLSRAWAVLAIKIVPKMTHRAPFCCTFWRVGSKVSFSLLFVSFSRGSDPRSARAGAVETQFFILGVASKRVSFLQQLLEHSWYIWRRNPLKKALQNRA
jgi:hypothetical protein